MVVRLPAAVLQLLTPAVLLQPLPTTAQLRVVILLLPSLRMVQLAQVVRWLIHGTMDNSSTNLHRRLPVLTP